MKRSGNMKVSVSVLKEHDNLNYAIKKVNETSADFLHIDVMDGVFVKNKCFPMEKVMEAKVLSKKPLDIHLMVKDHELIKKYASINPDYLTFHVEVIENDDLIKYVKEKKIKVGLAINPETSIDKLVPYLNDIDLVLFMSVEPGAGGQAFKKEVVDKIKVLKKIAPSSLIISIDGGVNDKTIGLCKDAGCNMVVAGSFITNENDYEDGIKLLR